MSSVATQQSPMSPSPTCFMLPYGYQIDLDFIKYCENLTHPDPTDAELQRRQRRRQRQSMEVMLGIQLEMQSQMDELSDFWERKPPAPPPRTHHHYQIESPIVPRYTNPSRQGEEAKWDSSLNEVVDDFERTLERSKKGKDKENRTQRERSKEKENFPSGDCIPMKEQTKVRRVKTERPFVHPPIETLDGVTLDVQPDRGAIQQKIRDLEEQAKLIPLLQIQIQTLRDERQHLQSQLESRGSSTSSSSPLPQHVFQAQRVSPVSLNSIKMTPIIPKRNNRSTGTNTSLIIRRDVGCSPEATEKCVHKATSTEFTLRIDGDGGRLYTESDLKKAIEMAHAKMRKATATVGTQFGESEKEKIKTRSIASGTVSPSSRNASSGTDEPNLMVTIVKGINITATAPAQVPVEQPDVPSLSLKDMNKLPVQRSSATQTQIPLVHQQATQSTISVTNKATDSNDLVRLVHKLSQSEVTLKRDQMSHTKDLLQVHQTGTNTPPVVVPITRSTASNTLAVTTKNVGVNCETQMETLTTGLNQQGNSKIPRPSPMAQRKFVRQDTFTVSKKPLEENTVKQCPAEMLLKLTMTQPRHHSPEPRIESPVHANFAALEGKASPDRVVEPPREKSPMKESVSLTPPIEEPSVGSSKMPMSPSIEYLDDDDFDDEYEDDKFNYDHVGPSVALRPPPTSISTIRLSQQNRVKIKPSKEMIAALKVLNDHLQKSPDPDESEIATARDLASREWFQISSTEAAESTDVEDYLDYFEEQSWELLTFMVNLADKNGNTAMHYAVSHGNFDVVSILLDSKVTSINQTNNAGYTCVMLVSLAKLLVEEHRTVVQRLFKLADVNIRATKNSQTALMLAVSHGNATIATMLVEAQADINIQDDDGSTALMCAAEHGHLDIVKFLLAQPDCDSTKVDVDGNTALKISLEAGYHDIGCLLYAHEHLLRNKTSLKRTPSSMKSSTSSLN